MDMFVLRIMCIKKVPTSAAAAAPRVLRVQLAKLLAQEGDGRGMAARIE